MLDLRLVGIHDDGENLVLESADGTTYRLPIDQNLRTSIAKARRIPQVRSLGGNGTFGPRDIQTRFRQGATVEEIVAESGWDANRVRRYEWPIVAERANIIQSAQNVVISSQSLGRRDAAALSLREHIAATAQRYGFTPEDAEWTTWQQESGQWTVSVDFAFGAEVRDGLPRTAVFPARWNYNPANQSIYASNEAAYFLMGRDHSSDAPLPGIGSHDTHENAPVQVAEPKITEVRVPHNPSHNELLDQLAQRRGTPATPQQAEQSAARSSAFYTSTEPAANRRGTPEERKLAELLERARRSSAARAESAPSAAHAETPAQDQQPEQAEPTAANDDSAHSNNVDRAEQVIIDQDAPAVTEVITVEEPAQEHAAEDQQDVENQQAVQHDDALADSEQSSNASAEPIEQKGTAPQLSAVTSENARPEVSVSTEEVSADTDPVETDTAGEPQASQSQPVVSVRESSDAKSESTESSTQDSADEEPAPARRSKRTSVPSWDDIIFGNQRRH
ncbi:septation protein SepH [Rothia sp. ZJ932]|uniref:septation protein SepH n=1 Tax=Rothia sp. ZJ932 TaxID=2810516 RepID=UPI0019676E31|nr:septation protein SepH [Rothia sp. ZJ932]QRZ60888.1 DUF3071 domain-containing protein [Rothia sp. ZJ932]